MLSILTVANVTCCHTSREPLLNASPKKVSICYLSMDRVPEGAWSKNGMSQEVVAREVMDEKNGSIAQP